MIGLILLIGLVVKNSILIIDKSIKKERKEINYLIQSLIQRPMIKTYFYDIPDFDISHVACCLWPWRW